MLRHEPPHKLCPIVGAQSRLRAGSLRLLLSFLFDLLPRHAQAFLDGTGQLLPAFDAAEHVQTTRTAMPNVSSRIRPAGRPYGRAWEKPSLARKKGGLTAARAS